MKTSTGFFFALLLGILLLMPVTKTFAFDNIAASSSEQTPTESDSESLKKKKGEETFFNFQVDKLSGKFFARLLINMLAVLILIRLIYYPNYRKSELFFTFFTFNFTIFLIAYLLNKVDMGMGAAFGLFAVFSMLRYRTENISAKDMTYLFLSIAIGLISAISKASATELVILNCLILLVTFFMEGNIFMRKEYSKFVQYENIEMIKPENYPALLSDMKKRTGLNIHRITIGKMDFLKDTAILNLHYYDEAPLPEATPLDPPTHPVNSSEINETPVFVPKI
jgi:hypothetical protein